MPNSEYHDSQQHDSQQHESGQWRPTASLEMLAARGQLIRQVRQFFEQRNFLEVQTPCLMPETVVDAQIDPIQVELSPGRHWFLQTSPEAAMKRLLAAGATAIFQCGPVFRGAESGSHHNPEFTMLEWYRRGDSMLKGSQLLIEFVQNLMPNCHPLTILTYRQLFQQRLGFDPVEISLDSLRQAVVRFVPSYQQQPSDSRDELLDVLLSLELQPQFQGLTVISNYPLSQAALARQSPSDPETAERFELFVEQVEIANGYAELTDAGMLAARVEQQNALRIAAGKSPLPPPDSLLAAMRAGLPESSGTAVGLDRLIMLALGAESLAEVIPFPHAR